MSMNIAQALKEKNRSAGRISRLQSDILKNNRYKSDTPAPLDANDLYEQLLAEKARLVNLKGKIAAANTGIVEKLAELAEAKDMISFVQGLESSTGIGGQHECTRDYNSGAITFSEYTIEYAFDSIRVRDMLEFYQERIESLQDEIDNYNATTQI
jgi:hypothetical protein